MDDAKRQTDQDALDFHALGKPGKFEISPTKPLNTQRDLSLAYSPGVAVPCLEIETDPVNAQALRNGRVYVESFTPDPTTFFGRKRAQGSHVVKSIG